MVDKSSRAKQALLGVDSDTMGNRLIRNYFNSDIKKEITKHHGDIDDQLNIILDYLVSNGYNGLVRLFEGGYDAEIRNFIEQIESENPEIVIESTDEALGLSTKEKKKLRKELYKTHDVMVRDKIEKPKRNIKVRSTKRQSSYKRSKPKRFTKREEVFIKSRLDAGVSVKDIINCE